MNKTNEISNSEKIQVKFFPALQTGGTPAAG